MVVLDSFSLSQKKTKNFRLAIGSDQKTPPKKTVLNHPSSSPHIFHQFSTFYVQHSTQNRFIFAMKSKKFH